MRKRRSKKTKRRRRSSRRSERKRRGRRGRREHFKYHHEEVVSDGIVALDTVLEEHAMAKCLITDIALNQQLVRS